MADETTPPSGSSPFTQVPVEVTVCVGKSRPKVRDLLRMGPGGVLPLDSTVEDPVELYVGDRLIARGELVEAEGATNGQLAVRLTEVVQADDSP
ncbi:MAG: FliM/FliN family flagellar motor C-terminal domain-containing protein [Pseudomonadota bacterium]